MKGQGAFYTGKYDNYLSRVGISDEKAKEILSKCFDTIFHGPEDKRLYHEVGPDMGYITDTGNDDVRTEGMSYGMMICAELDHKDEFDRIWKWTYTNMFLSEGKNKGFFCWSNALDGSKNADGPAPDGEEYFAMALLFASKRWGDGEGIFNYSKYACDILHEMIRIPEGDKGRGMFDPEKHLIRFITDVDFSDPSYHLPHFYELFALWAYPEDRAFFKEAAKASRDYFHKACHPVSGLSAEYAYYDGRPYEGGQDIWGKHDWYYSDAYRTIMNIAMDHIWFSEDPWQMEEGKRFLRYQWGLNASENVNRVPLWDGTLTDDTVLHPVAVIASNAAAAILSDGDEGLKCMEKFINTPLREGKRRYYDNLLYMFAFMMLSGNYRILG